MNRTSTTTSSNITTPTLSASTTTRLQEISFEAKRIVLPSLCLIGLLGNLLSVLILGKEKNRNTPIIVFFICLAVSDSLILLSGNLSEWILLMMEFDIRSVNGFLCKTHVFLAYFSLQFSSWMLVLITIERVISITVPHKVRLWCDRRIELLSLVVLTIVLVLLNGHFLLGMVHKYNMYTMRNCAGISEPYIAFLNEVWPKIDLVITFAAPLVVIIVGNTIIIIKMTIRARRSTQMGVLDQKKNSLTYVLLLLNTVFIISMGPSAVYLILYPHLVEIGYDLDTAYFVYDMVNLLAGLNATFNFVLYFLSGSKFREEVKALFCCKHLNKQGAF